jgi:predicted PurR-regulated permease PerM
MALVPPGAAASSSTASSSAVTRLRETKALKVLALLALLILLWIAAPLGVGLFLGVLLAFMLQPLDRRLRARGWSGAGSALFCVIGALLLTSLGIVAFAALFVRRGLILAETAPSFLEPTSRMHEVAERAMIAVHVEPEHGFAQLEAELTALGSRAGEIATQIVGAAFMGFLTLLFMGLASYYVLRHWEGIVKDAELVLPIAPKYTRSFFGQFRTVGADVLRGTVVTGLVQGVLAGLGYWATGVPDPAFFGALTAVASLVPAVGTLVVWITVGVYLIVMGHEAMGIAELVYGALVVGILVDYVIRPMLVGRGTHVPAVYTFVALFGGIAAFGLIGLVLGPVLVTLCVAILKTYEGEVIRAPRMRVAESMPEGGIEEG